MPRAIALQLAGDQPALSLLLDYNAVAALESVCSRDGGFLVMYGSGMHFSFVRAGLWAAAADAKGESRYASDETWTLRRAGQLLGQHLEAGGKLTMVADTILEALRAAGFHIETEPTAGQDGKEGAGASTAGPSSAIAPSPAPALPPSDSPASASG